MRFTLFPLSRLKTMDGTASGKVVLTTLITSPFFSRTMLDASALTKALSHGRLVSYMDVMNTTLLIYDVILNLPLEIEHIWTKQWGFLTVLYIIQRYLPFFDTAGVALHLHFGANLSPEFCTSGYKIAGWSFIGGVMLSEILLTLRVWAVWRRRILVGLGLVLFFLACWVPGSYYLAQFLNATKFATIPFPIPHFRGCFISGGSIILYLCWVLWMVYDTGTLIMMLIPGISAYRKGGRSELIKTVYRDGVIYYAFVFLVSTINVVSVLRLSSDLVQLLTSFERVLHSLLTSRAILHIRQLGSKCTDARTISQSHEVSTDLPLFTNPSWDD
ncbi:hypothetical protein L218DRAFT_336282 [Marasmius fiardii PR-910]|nr:hypothetical protein L218DRAFT_336282 [Marasmius fiardii PR-910]